MIRFRVPTDGRQSSDHPLNDGSSRPNLGRSDVLAGMSAHAKTRRQLMSQLSDALTMVAIMPDRTQTGSSRRFSQRYSYSFLMFSS